MKKLFLLAFAAVLAVGTTFAQSNKEEVELIQSIFGMEKKAVVAEFIELEGEAATAFWALYDEYEAERKANGQERVNVVDKYANNYVEMADVVMDELVAKSMKLNDAHTKLVKTYYKKIKKASGSKAASQFFQLENYFNNVVYMTLISQIPLIGEFDK